jgi:hypothetical protein
MSGKSFSEEVAGELVGKALMWGPATAGLLLLGPLGVLVGLAASVAIVCSGNSGDARTGSSTQKGRKGAS